MKQPLPPLPESELRWYERIASGLWLDTYRAPHGRVLLPRAEADRVIDEFREVVLVRTLVTWAVVL